jgi:alpha-glucuronidase
MINKKSKMYSCWLSHTGISNSDYKEYLGNIVVSYKSKIIESALTEFKRAFQEIYDTKIEQRIWSREDEIEKGKYIKLERSEDERLISEGYKIKHEIASEKKQRITISAKDDNGILYGVFALLRLFEQNKQLEGREIIDNPRNKIRMVDHWDNLDGTVERGFAGSSILFESCRNKDITKYIMETIGIPASNDLIREAFSDEYKVASNLERINDYARMLCSIGINGVVINNTNVHT